MTRLAIFGRGRMGKLIRELAPGAGFTVVAQRGASDALAPVTREALGGAEVAIEFTVPAAAAGIVRSCVAAGIPVVSGTTGWDGDRAAVEAEVRARKGALLWAPNFAIGVHHFAAIVEEAARRLLGAGFAARITETHHAQKLDAPSGTAKLLATRVARTGGAVPEITSVRTGSVPGTHELFLEAPYETVHLVHEAKDRRVFAAGALTAAKWIVGRTGVFNLSDLDGAPPP